MTRGRASHAERDLHALFTAWLQGGAGGDPPRDAAVHAAHCIRCRAATMALDHLSVIDVGRAPMPPSRGLIAEHAGSLARPRLVAAGASAFVVVAVAAWIGFGALLPNPPGATGPSADQEVLGGFGAGGSATADASAATSFGGVTIESESAIPGPSLASADPTQAATATHVVSATPLPTAVQPPTSPPQSNPQTPAPTARPSQPASATAPPTATPEPTPSPAPECSDGIDNDDDTFIDFGLDPGCLSPDDDSEDDLL